VNYSTLDFPPEKQILPKKKNENKQIEKINKLNACLTEQICDLCKWFHLKNRKGNEIGEEFPTMMADSCSQIGGWNLKGRRMLGGIHQNMAC